MSAFKDLADRWRADAELLRSYGADDLAAATLLHARQLEEVEVAARDEALSIGDAARESHYSERRLRELIAAGAVPNASTAGPPTIRRADLPRRSKRNGDPAPFDAAAEARALLAKRNSNSR